MTRPYHHGQLRRALLEAAVSIVQNEGVTPISLRSLAKTVGVSATSVYRHFASWSDLLGNVAEYARSQLFNRQLAVLRQPETTSLLESGKDYVAYALENRALFQMIFDPEFQTPGSKETRTDLLASLEAAAPGANPRLTAMRAWALAHGIAELTLCGCFNEAEVIANLDELLLV